MDAFDEVSKTALITLKARIVEARKSRPLIEDQTGIRLYEELVPRLPMEIREWIENLKVPSGLINYIVLRTRRYDYYCREFLNQNKSPLVISLGCGFDTRFWRISSEIWNYMELDLPSVVEVKKEVLKKDIPYPMIGASVLDWDWLKQILSRQKRDILFLAEGLFMYLPEDQVRGLFYRMSESFSNSQLAFEAVHRKYTRGMWKKVVESKMRRRVGSGAGAAYQFGITGGKEVESFGRNLRLVDEWSYFEDPDVSPKILRLFRHFESLSRTQWTVRVAIG